MATIKIPVSIVDSRPTIPVTITNPETKKKITLSMTLDTGWEMDNIDLKHGNTLGYNPANAIAKGPNFNMYLTEMTIGSLKPITTYLNVGFANANNNIFGLLPMRQYDNFIITKNTATITDSTTGGGTQEGLVKIMKDYNKYIHTSGVPVLAKKQALFAASRSNAGAYWRNRM